MLEEFTVLFWSLPLNFSLFVFSPNTFLSFPLLLFPLFPLLSYFCCFLKIRATLFTFFLSFGKVNISNDKVKRYW
jgi:hypothetical protein